MGDKESGQQVLPKQVVVARLRAAFFRGVRILPLSSSLHSSLHALTPVPSLCVPVRFIAPVSSIAKYSKKAPYPSTSSNAAAPQR